MQLTKLIGFLLEEEGGSGDKWEQATDMWFYEHPGSGFSDHVLEVMEANAIPVYEELIESGWWCPGNCDLATQKWKQVFEEAGIPVKVMNGFYSRDHEAGDSHMSSSEHVWLEVDGGLFDPTAGQFAGEISIENYWLDDHKRAYDSSMLMNDSVTLYHGTLKENVPSILSGGLKKHSGWGGAGTEGVYLSKTPSGAEYWAKIAYMSKNEESLEPEKFDRKYGDKKQDLISILRIVIPTSEMDNLRADMEQAEDYGFEGESEDWQQSLDVIGDVMYDGDIPSSWITVLQ